jgi:hypothetical protein
MEFSFTLTQVVDLSGKKYAPRLHGRQGGRTEARELPRFEMKLLETR